MIVIRDQQLRLMLLAHLIRELQGNAQTRGDAPEGLTDKQVEELQALSSAELVRDDEYDELHRNFTQCTFATLWAVVHEFDEYGSIRTRTCCRGAVSLYEGVSYRSGDMARERFPSCIDACNASADACNRCAV